MTDAAIVIRPTGRRPRGLAAIASFAALVVLAGAVLFPVLATALNGFKDLSELRTNPLGLPHVWMWSNYWSILTGYRYWQVLGNSLLIALFTVALTLVVSSMAAFTFAHLRFFGDRFLLSYIQLGLAVPGGDGDRAALHQDPGSWPAQFLLGHHPAAGRVLAGDERAAHSQRLQAIAGRIARRGDDGRLRLLPLLLLHHPAALWADPVDGRGHLLRRQLERLSAAAHRPQSASRAIPGRSASWPTRAST